MDKKEKISSSRKGRIWITNGKETKSIYPDDLERFPEWTRGRNIDMEKVHRGSSQFRKSRIYVTNGRICRLIPKSDFKKWEAEGFERGRIVRNLKVKRGDRIEKISIFDLIGYLERGYKLISNIA